MTHDECLASLRLLLAVARADGEVHQRERDAIDVLARTTFGAESPDIAMDLDIEAECAKITEDKVKRLTLSGALVIADIDEQRSPEETAVIERIHKGLGLTGEAEGAMLKAAHRARMGLLTAKLAAVQTAFFRELAQLAKSGPIDASVYEHILDELERKKTELLKHAV